MPPPPLPFSTPCQPQFAVYNTTYIRATEHRKNIWPQPLRITDTNTLLQERARWKQSRRSPLYINRTNVIDKERERGGAGWGQLVRLPVKILSLP